MRIFSVAAALLVVPIASPALSHAADIGAPFPIAATPGIELALDAAFDGTNFLVCITGDAAASDRITAQLVSPAGSLVGPLISLGSTGGWCSVAFDGDNYLAIWADASATSVQGQFVSTQGALVAAPFTIGTATSLSNVGLLFDGSNYFIEWEDQLEGHGSQNLYGQFISKTGGKLGSLINVSTAVGGQRGTSLAFDGTNILAVWVDGRKAPDDYEMDEYGQFITKSSGSTAGALLGSNFLINGSSVARDHTNPMVAFNGTHYLVVITEPLTSPDGRMWIVGQIVDTSGANVGGPFTLDTPSTDKWGPFVATDGTDFLVTWADRHNDTNEDGACDAGEGSCWDLGGQFISGDGVPIGSEFSIDSDANNQFGGPVYGSGEYLLIINDFGGFGDQQVGDVRGRMLTPSSLSVGDVSVPEGDSGTTTAVFTVVLSSAVGPSVTVDYATADGTAMTADSDYVATSGTLTFPSGVTTQTVNVTVNGDARNEPDETLTLNLSGPTNATIADGQAVGTIVNDDPVPTLSVDDVTVGEGNSGQTPVTFTLTLSSPTSSTVSVSFQTVSQSAVAGSDFVAVSGTLTFSPDEVSQPLTVQVLGDPNAEGDETFAVVLSNASGAGISKSTGIATILDDDPFFQEVPAGLAGVHGGTAAWGDYDNDGDLDALLTGSDDSGTPVSRVYRNDSGVFTDIGAGLTGVTTTSAAAWGDYDNDGDLDIVLTGSTGSYHAVAKVYRNDGGIFTDAAAGLSGVFHSSIAWGDYDSDGDLDVVFTGWDGSWTCQSKVYRNGGAGVFTNIGAGLTGITYGSVAWGDYDNDGDLDILLAGATCPGALVTKVYRNDAGEFTDIAAGLPGVYLSTVAWGDYDNDGDLDILLTGSTVNNNATTTTTRLYRNDGGAFTDIAAGLTGVVYGSVAWGDYDNDGDLDILLTGSDTSQSPVTKVYRNNSGGGFTDIAAGLAAVQSSSAAWGDYDNDGDLDILLTGHTGSSGLAKVYRNNATTPNSVPAAPTNLATTVDGLEATLSWDASSDTQTPAQGLSYNLRLGTSPGAGDVAPPMAAVAGYRRIPALGNAQHGTTALIRALSPGTYYWTVQAVDSAFAGSPFAGEGSLVVEPCTYAIDPGNVAPAAAGGSGTVAVDAGAGCDWTAVSNDGWITVTAGASGSGDGTVSYSVDANLAGARTSTVTIAGQTFTVNQAAAACHYSIDPTSAGFDWPGGSGAVDVTAESWCDWTATSNDLPWLTVTSGTPGTGNGSVAYSVAANGLAERTGTITIRDHTFAVTQAPHPVRELAHGSDAWQSLAALGGAARSDYYRLAQQPYSSYEVVVEGESGDVQPVQLDRLGSDDTTVLPPASQAIGVGVARSLRWRNNLSSPVTSESILVRSGGSCSADCGADDVYRIRAYETTYTIPRFNNAGTQVTVLLLHNPASYAIDGAVYFWSGDGTLLHTQPVSIAPHGGHALNTSTVAALQGKSGTVTVANDGRYGDLAGKAVALEPASGFSFDSPMVPRPVR